MNRLNFTAPRTSPRSASRSDLRARVMLQKLAAAGVEIVAVKALNGKWGIRFPEAAQHTPAQRELAVDAALLGIAWPRAFGVMIRLLRESVA